VSVVHVVGIFVFASVVHNGVGELVGAFVGGVGATVVGASVGESVGANVGAFVGSSVGAEVGDCVSQVNTAREAVVVLYTHASSNTLQIFLSLLYVATTHSISCSHLSLHSSASYCVSLYLKYGSPSQACLTS
jgi:hypothetical protein